MSFGSENNNNYNGEYDDNNTFNEGKALYINGSYSEPGLGVSVSLKSIDNMDFRSSRRSQLTDLVLNFLVVSGQFFSVQWLGALTIYKWSVFSFLVFSA